MNTRTSQGPSRTHPVGRDSESGPTPWAAMLSVAAALLAALLTATWHHRWERAANGTPERGLLDGLCHAGTALAVALPVLPYVREQGPFLRVALASALLIDLDHIAAARSLRLDRCMTMATRPLSHSLLTPILLAVLAERLAPERHLGLAALLGLGSHLLRDLYTGGVPVLHPRHVVSLPPRVVIPLLGLLAIFSRSATRRRLGTRLLRLAMP
ncbi:metal-dependent hydrolase [Sphaerobacter sp.]|uniref:metal-dependent hydrolase n=1 Tax=Sphaerobacter sp. TaxID=2099654 RepID=UPI0025E71DC9|nr:metal-dependent hydrolase [Sphaerobacter sp.]